MTSPASPEPVQTPPVAPGTILAHRYRVDRILGRGGMGYVVEAMDIALDARVALKFLLPEYAQHPEAALRFQREARAARKIQSEHVTRVFDVDTLETGAPYMVMEFLEGADLARMLKDRGVFSVTEAVDHIIEACEAIAEAHNYGIVHRDLKPANLFLAKRPDGTPIVKVLDFGISKIIGAGDHALTRSSTAMGSALYMSPEQMQETRAVDHRTDVYALGIALYELLAGKPPFYANTLPQLCAEVLTGKPKPLRDYRPDLPEDLARRIERAYERDKGQRYQSIGEFVAALAPYAPKAAQGTIDRIARMSRGSMPSVPETIAAGVMPGLTLGASGLSEPTASPVSSTLPATTAATVPQAAGQGPLRLEITVPLPAAAGRANPLPLPGVDARTALSTADADESRIVADTYEGPMSANAAAAFASASQRAHMNQASSGRGVLITALVLGALFGVGGGTAMFLLRYRAELDPGPAAAPVEPGLPSATPAPVVSPAGAPLPPSPSPGTTATAQDTQSPRPAVTAPAAPLVTPLVTPPAVTAAPRDKGGSVAPPPAHAPTTHTPSRPSAEPSNGNKNVFEAR